VIPDTGQSPDAPPESTYDGRALSTTNSKTERATRLPAALVYGLSVPVLSAIVVATAVFGLGVRTSYGSGIDPGLGSQVQRDFLADQDAEAAALSKADPRALSNRLTGNALQDVSQQVSDETAAGLPPTVSFQPTSLTVLRAQDPTDLSLLIEVQEDGTKNIIHAAGPDSAPTQQSVNFHGDFWLRQDSSGRYLIADQSIQDQPSSFLPTLALVAAGLAWIGLAALLVLRRRSRGGPIPTLLGPFAAAPTAEVAPVASEPDVQPTRPPPEVLIRTFGGLELHQGGKELAAALKLRPVTAFIWLRLLLAAVRDGNARLSRDELGKQASPGLDRETQLKRMRNVIHQGLRELPPALSQRIQVEPQLMSFRLDGCEIDAITLLAVCAECAGRSSLSAAQTVRARAVLQASQGVFLPEFESIEDIATDRHPTCTDLIRAQRELLSAKRLELSLVLAASYLTNARPAEAIAVLEPAFQERPERGDLRARLAAAYRAAGRQAEASALEAELA
jgi:hypothetical protein